MSLNEQGESREHSRDAESNREANRVRRGHSTTVGLSPLPQAPDDSCCTAGFGGREVAGPDGAREVRGLGEMSSEVTTRGERRVSTGCGCGPNGNATTSDPERETPLGVDQVNGPPIDGVCCEDVGDNHALIGDVKPWTPEGGIDGGSEKAKNRDAANESVCCEREESRSDRQTENTDGHRGEYTAGSGHERHHENNAGMKVER